MDITEQPFKTQDILWIVVINPKSRFRGSRFKVQGSKFKVFQSTIQRVPHFTNKWPQKGTKGAKMVIRHSKGLFVIRYLLLVIRNCTPGSLTLTHASSQFLARRASLITSPLLFSSPSSLTNNE